MLVKIWCTKFQLWPGSTVCALPGGITALGWPAFFFSLSFLVLPVTTEN